MPFIMIISCGNLQFLPFVKDSAPKPAIYAIYYRILTIIVDIAGSMVAKKPAIYAIYFGSFWVIFLIIDR